MYNEVNTKTNLPAQIEIYSTDTNHYSFLFIAKGGGSANKTYLYQQTKALLNPQKLLAFINEKVKVRKSTFKKCLEEKLIYSIFLQDSASQKYIFLSL